MDDDLHRKGLVIFQKIFGAKPDEEVDIAPEQLSALRALLTTGGCYFDFAIWGPYGTRSLRAQKTTGMIVNGAGQLQRIELKGPQFLRRGKDAGAF